MKVINQIAKKYKLKIVEDASVLMGPEIKIIKSLPIRFGYS